MKRIHWIIAAAVTLTLTACASETTTPKERNKIVKTAVAEPCQSNGSVTLPAKISAAEEVRVAFKVSGSLQNIPVEVGQSVKAGEVIAEMDSRDYEIQFSATEAEYKQLKGEAERVMELYKKNSVSKSDYEKAYYGLQQITAKYNAHKNALADTKLRAPFDAVVRQTLYSKGETIGAGYPVIVLISCSAPEVEVGLPASVYMLRDRFVGYECRQELFPDKQFALAPTSISPQANLNQLYTARFRFTDTNIELPSAGLTASVTISYRNESADRLSVVPLTAVCGSEESASVWIYNPETSTVASREVVVERIDTDGKATVSGLSAGEIVVSAGVNSLREGRKVTPAAPKTKTNKGGLL